MSISGCWSRQSGLQCQLRRRCRDQCRRVTSYSSPGVKDNVQRYTNSTMVHEVSVCFPCHAERANPDSYASCAGTPCHRRAAPLNVTVTPSLVMNMCSLLENNSDLARESW